MKKSILLILMGCIKLSILDQSYSQLRVVHSVCVIEVKPVQVWLRVDPRAESLMSLSPYNSMGNNPISHSDPNGDLFFAVPQFSFSGGFSVGLKVGVGFPVGLNLSVSGGVNLSSGAGYWSAQAEYLGGYAGYGSNGWFAGYGVNLGGGFNLGASTGAGGSSVGLNYGGSLGGNSSGSLGLSYGTGGFGFNASTSYFHEFKQREWSPDITGNPGSGKGGTQSVEDCCPGLDRKYDRINEGYLKGEISYQEFKDWYDAQLQGGMMGLSLTPVGRGVGGAVAAYRIWKLSKVSRLINSTGSLTMKKSGWLVGEVSGNGSAIFSRMTRGATQLSNGMYQLKNGATVGYHTSARGGGYTIRIINNVGKYKIRVN